MITIGIEGTAHTIGIGILDDDKIIANVSKMYIPPQGGIHPREAANHHVTNFVPTLKEALTRANIQLKDIDLVAFSKGPGLGPCLRTAATAARTIALKLNIPILGVNHCIAHLEIGKALTGSEDPVFVYLSGGNTQIISYKDGKYRVFGETLDIGIGNMLDKIARQFNLPFPGGPKLEVLAKAGSKIYNLPYSVKGMDVSFSGLYTAVISLYKNGAMINDLAKSIQETAFAMITEVAERALTHLYKDELLLSGGVARNKRLQEMLQVMTEKRRAKFYVPPPEVCVDNGAMIGYLGYLMYREGIKMDLKDTEITQKFRVDEIDVSWVKQNTHFKHYLTFPGAEAMMVKTEFFGRKSLRKIRIRKEYRDTQLDLMLRKERLKKEVRLLVEVKKLGVHAPVVYDVDLDTMYIELEYINAPSLRDTFDTYSSSEKTAISKKLGIAIATMHNHHVSHGDLTTSNIIYHNQNLYFIDFSMGSKNAEIEDLGVDLHLLKESFYSTHFQNRNYFNIILNSYKSHAKNSENVIAKMKEIEKRRRYL